MTNITISNDATTLKGNNNDDNNNGSRDNKRHDENENHCNNNNTRGAFQQQRRRRRKLRPLVITTLGSERQEQIHAMFCDNPIMQQYFEMPVYSPAVSSRDLGNRTKCFQICNEAGLLPRPEWLALSQAIQSNAYHPERLFDCLKDIPINSNDYEIYNNTPQNTSEDNSDDNNNNDVFTRRGSQTDVQKHYSVELWQKAKTINRGRSVLACTLAHLIALNHFFYKNHNDDNDDEESCFDFIIEDNVRCPIYNNNNTNNATNTNKDSPDDDYSEECECAQRIWEAKEASLEWDQQQQDEKKCHLRYYGWLGSIPNLQWIFQRHALQTKFPRMKQQQQQTNSLDEKNDNHDKKDDYYTIFPFPTLQDVTIDLEKNPWVVENNGNDDDAGCTTNGSKSSKEKQLEENNTDNKYEKSTPGGTIIWGSYAYWISKKGYVSMLRRLRSDVGSLMWKGKRQRYYNVKPYDKILPRHIMDSTLSRARDTLYSDCIHLTTHPAFFRAPMLTSKIHTKFDPSFCMSTTYQLSQAGNITWVEKNKEEQNNNNNNNNNTALWTSLSVKEQQVVKHHNQHGVWLTPQQIITEQQKQQKQEEEKQQQQQEQTEEKQ